MSGDQLQLEGDSLTLGIDLNVPVPEQLSAVGRQALTLLGDFLEGKIEEENLNRFKLTRTQ